MSALCYIPCFKRQLFSLEQNPNLNHFLETDGFFFFLHSLSSKKKKKKREMSPRQKGVPPSPQPTETNQTVCCMVVVSIAFGKSALSLNQKPAMTAFLTLVGRKVSSRPVHIPFFFFFFKKKKLGVKRWFIFLFARCDFTDWLFVVSS